jgi:two-component system sensor histidine kinase KdpD
MAQTRVIEAQAAFSRKLAAASTEDDVLWATVTQVHARLGGKAVLMAVEGAELVARAAWPPDELADPVEAMAARWALEKGEAAGWRTGTLPNIRFRFQPLMTSRRVVAVLGFEPPDRDVPLAAEDETKLDALVEQAAIALDRALLVREAVKAAALQENDNIRDALLASLSHDLRTPLAAITGSVSTLQQMGQALPEAQQQDLLHTIRQEAGRLNRFVTNLLEMSRIESGAIKVKRDWVDVGDAVRAAVDRCGKAHPGRSSRISLAPDLKFVRGDQDLLGQVVFNLLDNAHKYADEGEVVVHARNDGNQVLITVTDEGPGIKPADLDRIFEKFYRGGGTDRRKPGTGLGLSICRGLLKAMGGTILAESPAARRRGTRIIVRLPAAELPAFETPATEKGAP